MDSRLGKRTMQIQAVYKWHLHRVVGVCLLRAEICSIGKREVRDEVEKVG